MKTPSLFRPSITSQRSLSDTLLLVCVMLWVASYLLPSAYALQFVVDNGGDSPDANPGDGNCADLGGACTLRAAIDEANVFPDLDVILIPAGTITILTGGISDQLNISGDFDILEDVDISGVGGATIIDGGGLDRVFHIAPGAEVSFSEFTIQNGRTSPSDNGVLGGNGGGILNQGDLVLDDMAVLNNVTASGDLNMLNGFSGAGIYNAGDSLRITRCHIANNRTGNGADGGNGGSGAGLFDATAQQTIVVDSVFQNNVCGVGGESRPGGNGGAAFVAPSADIIFTDCTVLDNLAGAGGTGSNTAGGNGGDGGALYIAGSAQLLRSTLNRNNAGNGAPGDTGGNGGNGGGIFVTGTSNLENSTLSANTAGNGAAATGVGTGGNGGSSGALHLPAGGSGSATLTHCTVAFNTAGAPGGGLNPGSPGNAGGISGDEQLEIGHSIFQDNTVTGGAIEDVDDSNGSGPSVSLGWVIFTGGPYSPNGNSASNKGGVSANLLPLVADSGGVDQGPSWNVITKTLVHPITQASPAYNCGNPSIATPPATDQRGSARVSNLQIDIGAFEVFVPVAIDLSITKEMPACLLPGETFEITLTVSNAGPVAAPCFTVSDPLNSIFLFSSSSQCTESFGTVSCSVSDLAAGASTSLSFMVTADAAAAYNNPDSNSASVQLDTCDPGVIETNNVNNFASAPYDFCLPPCELDSASVSPSSNEVGVVQSSDIVVNFTGTPSTNNIILRAHSNSGILTGAVTWTVANGITTLTFNPDRDLFAGEEVKVTVTDTAGIGGDCAEQWAFTAGPINDRCFAGFREDTAASAVLPGVVLSSVDWGDYDNDGDLDILLSGEVAASQITEVYENTGSGFTSINAGLPGVFSSSVDWGDYDNDGDLDILLSGRVGITEVYENTGSGFTSINAGLPGVEYSSVDWGDYDNDGDLDILLSGRDLNFTRFTEVYENTGSGFTSINAGLPRVRYSSVDWGDYDNDGDLDILLSGEDANGTRITEVYENTGSGFTSINAGLPGVRFSSVDWGDYDNDGDLDILLSGYDTSNTRITEVYENTGSSFTSINAGLPGVRFSSVDWGDYDNDGDLDILLSGRGASGTRITEVYENTGSGFTSINAGLPTVWRGSVDWGDYDNDGDLDILLSGTGASGIPITEIHENLGCSDLAVTKTATGPFVAGTRVDFTLTVTNRGADTAYGVMLVDTLSNGLSALGSNLFALGDLAAGASTSVVVSALVDADPAVFASCEFVNEASVVSAFGEVTVTNNITAFTGSVTAVSDLVLTHNGPAGPIANAGSTSFELIVSNAGPSVASAVSVTNALPVVAGVSYSSATLDVATGLWNVGPLAVGQSATSVVTVTLSDCCLDTVLTPIAIASHTGPCPSSEAAPADNTASASATLVSDTAAPVFTVCPAGGSVALGAPPPPAADVALATVTDNCGVPAITVTTNEVVGTCSNLVQHIYTASDSCGNASSCTQTWIVAHPATPVIACAAAITVDCIGLVPPADLGSVVTSDPCQNVTISVVTNGAITACPGMMTYVFTAVNESGISASCTQTVTLTDTELSTFTVSNIVVECAAEVEAAVGSGIAAFDNCRAVLALPTVGALLNSCSGSTDLVYTVSDDCGNAVSFTQTISWVDTIAPVITTCPADLALPAGAVFTPDVLAVQASDNCGIAGVTAIQRAITNTCGEAIEVVYTASDLCGNAAVCTQTVARGIASQPVIDCPADGTAECLAAVPPPAAPTVTDPCSTPVITVTTNINGTDCAGTVEYVYTAVNAFGNTAVCTQAFVIADTTPPQLTCPAPATLPFGTAVVPDPSTATATDNCGTATVTGALGATTDTAAGQLVEVIYTATDACGNSSACTQLVTLTDSTPPQITCPGDLALPPGTPFAPDPASVQVTASCGTATVTAEQTAITNTCGEAIEVVYTATDACGNTASCTQFVSRGRTSVPVIACPADATVECIGDVPPAGTPTVSDDCATPSISVTTNVVGDDCSGEVQYIFTASNAFGNVAVCTQIISYADTQVPALICVQSFTVRPRADQDAVVDAADLVVSSDDNCGIVSTEIRGQSVFTCSDTGTGTIQVIVSDACGNATVCDVPLTVASCEEPSLAVNIVVDDPGCFCAFGPGTFTISITNNGPLALNSVVLDDPLYPACATNIGTLAVGESLIYVCEVTLTGTVNQVLASGMANGLTTTAEKTVTYAFDATPPTITACPADIVLVCGDPLPGPDTASVSVSDDCPSAALVTVFKSTLIPNCAGAGMEYVYEVADACGNVGGRCTQLVSYATLAVPVFSATPPSGVLPCGSDLPGPAALSATDGCGNNLSVEIVTETTALGCTGAAGVRYRYTATDVCGQTTSHEQAFTFTDDTPPQLECLGGDQSFIVSSADCLIQAPMVERIVSDNCAGPLTVVQSPAPGTPQDATQPMTITVTATDSCGNQSSCSVIYTYICTVQITGVVWQDLAVDGDPTNDDLSALGLSGVGVSLTDPDDGTVLDTTVTDGLGRYAFEVPPGIYRLVFDEEGLPAGLDVTTLPDLVDATMGNVAAANLGVTPAPTAIALERMAADVNENGSVSVSWSTGWEEDTLGYRVWRGTAEGPTAQLDGFVLADGSTSAYAFSDQEAASYYWLEVIDTDLESEFVGSAATTIPAAPTGPADHVLAAVDGTIDFTMQADGNVLITGFSSVPVVIDIATGFRLGGELLETEAGIAVYLGLRSGVRVRAFEEE